MTWGPLIYLYLWLAGMAGGAFMAAFLVDRFTGGGNKPLLRLATYLGIPLAVIGVILLIFDLGHIQQFWHLMGRFYIVSPMSMGTWILLLWVGAAVVLVILWLAESYVSKETAASLKGITGLVSWAELVLSAFIMSYTGVLLATSNQPIWSDTWLLPALFVTSAVSTGVALLVLTSLVTERRYKKTVASGHILSRLAEADAILILMELGVLAFLAVWMGATASESLRLLIIGTLAAPFWVGVIAFALLIPLWLELANWGKELTATRSTLRMALASTTIVVLGGLVLRAVITIGGQL